MQSNDLAVEPVSSNNLRARPSSTDAFHKQPVQKKSNQVNNQFNPSQNTDCSTSETPQLNDSIINHHFSTCRKNKPLFLNLLHYHNEEGHIHPLFFTPDLSILGFSIRICLLALSYETSTFQTNLAGYFDIGQTLTQCTYCNANM